MASKTSSSKTNQSAATIGFEAKLTKGDGEYPGTNAEDPDEYRPENVFW